MIIQITSNYFCAGIIFESDLFDDFHVVKAAPILNYMIGWHYDRVKNYCLKKNFNFMEL